MKKIIIYIVTGVTLFFCVECTNSNKSVTNDEGVQSLKNDSILKTGFDNSLSMPSPDEVMSWFADSDLKYNANLVNKPENFEKYLSSKSLSLNLGVYVTDAAYINMFKQYEVLPKYIENIFNINDKLDLTGVYMEFDFKEVFKSMNNPDSLILLSEGMYKAITNYMVETENEPMLCLISHGSLIELLHLTLQSVEVFKADDPILQGISDQYMQLDNLYNYANRFNENADVNEMLTQLSSIRSIFSQIEQTKKENSILKDDDGKLTLQGGVKHQITAEQFKNLKETVTGIRNTIIL